MIAKQLIFRYRVDARDRLVFVDPLWLAFARENGAADLTEQRVIGRSLWDFVADAETIRLYRELHARVRGCGAPAVVSFRCDSPRLQRDMRLTICPEPAGALRYESVIVQVTPRTPLRVLDPSVQRTRATLTLCSGCKCALVEPTGWLDAEQTTAKLRSLRASAMPLLQYWMCPNCTAGIEAAPIADAALDVS
ncbi:MAG: hypothetical protein KDA44_03430 [Planctomycetales bacterium]|nr:hypothetical protein [Planctomycetales bacterium]